MFDIEGAGPWTGPAALALSMGYDDMVDSYEQRASKGGGCTITPQKPQGICSVRASYAAPAFAAANGRFFESPRDAWYAFARALVAARHASYAATDLRAASAKQLAAWGGAVGLLHAIDISDNVLPFVGQRDRFSSTVATTNGGMALVGTRRGAQVVVARTDNRGTVQWEAVIAEPANQGTVVIDGYVQTEKDGPVRADGPPR